MNDCGVRQWTDGRDTNGNVNNSWRYIKSVSKQGRYFDNLGYRIAMNRLLHSLSQMARRIFSETCACVRQVFQGGARCDRARSNGSNMFQLRLRFTVCAYVCSRASTFYNISFGILKLKILLYFCIHIDFIALEQHIFKSTADDGTF